MSERERLLAEQLLEAQDRGELVDLPSESFDLDVTSAYQVQGDIRHRLEARGDQLVGFKLGFTSEAKRIQMKISDPIFGFLTAGMELAPGEIDLRALAQPRVEPEIAFRLGSDLTGPAVGREEVIAATAEVLAAVEILDSRYRGFRFTLPDVIADNTSASRYVLATEGRSPNDLNLVAERVEMRVGEGEPLEASGADVFGDPAEAVAWLARRQPLRAGMVVLSGGMTSALPVAGRDPVLADFSSLGRVEFVVT